MGGARSDVRPCGAFGHTDRGARAGDHAGAAEGAPRSAPGDRQAEPWNPRRRHCRVLAIGRLCRAEAPRRRLPAQAADVLVRLLPRDEAAGARAREAHEPALQEGAGLHRHALLGRREPHGARRPGSPLLGFGRVLGLGLRRIPERCDRPHEARGVPVLPEGGERPGGRRGSRADRERRHARTYCADLGHALRAGEDPGLVVSSGVAADLAPSSTVHIELSVSTRTARASNVIADLPGRQSGVVLLGGHLDSVASGPGINDNGSGSALVLEVARQARRLHVRPRHGLRFAFWGGEESACSAPGATCRASAGSSVHGSSTS